MNEMMMYEDICDELAYALGGGVDSAAVEELCKGWVGYLEETKAENSRLPVLVALPSEISERSGYEGAVYALRDDTGDSDHSVHGTNGSDRNATGVLDKPRLLKGRMFQIEDIIYSIGFAFVKSFIKDAVIKAGGQGLTSGDPATVTAALVAESIPDIICDLRAFLSGKPVEGPEERAIVIMAFSQYETDLHDTKNEPFTAEAMVEWLKWANEDGAPGMPPRVRYSVRAVKNGLWKPSVDEVEDYLRKLEPRFFTCVKDDKTGRQYQINI